MPRADVGTMSEKAEVSSCAPVPAGHGHGQGYLEMSSHSQDGGSAGE